MKINNAKICSALIVIFLSFLTGCALTTDTISLTYVSPGGMRRLSGAEDIPVTVIVNDQRDRKDAVGAKINGYGMEMAPIVSETDVVKLLKESLEAELAGRGFKAGSGNSVSVVADLSKFMNRFKTGFWSGDSIAEVTMNILVKNQAGALVYSKLISGTGKEPNIQIANGNNAQHALEAALTDAIRKLFSDEAFTAALIKTKGP